MIEKVKERVKAWKRFYASRTTGVDENSSWVDILLKLNLSFPECVILGKQAIQECSPFSFEESLYLGQLPYYKEVKELLAGMPNEGLSDCFVARMLHGDDIYFVRYPKQDDEHGGDNLQQVPIVVATIVYHRPVDFDEEVYAWCNYSITKGWTCKHLIIRYDTEKPADFILPVTVKEDSDEFDVLCEVDGQKVRLPFSKRHLGKPIGIFPFKEQPEYIELDEVENKKHTDKDVDNSRLLDREFCNYVYPIKERLNVYLKALGKPLLDGGYLADSAYMRDSGWIVGFEDNEFHTLSSDYYGGNVPEKLRYMGRFEGQCQK